MLMASFDTNSGADDETYGPETEAQKGQFTLKHNLHIYKQFPGERKKRQANPPD